MDEEMKMEYTTIVEKINHYDTMRSVAKGWFFTAWVAIITIAFGYGRLYMLPVGIVIVLFFWYTEYRLAYFQRICFAREEILEFAALCKLKKISDEKRDSIINKKYKTKDDPYVFHSPGMGYHFKRSFHNRKAKTTALFGKNLLMTYTPLLILTLALMDYMVWSYRDDMDHYVGNSFQIYTLAMIILITVIPTTLFNLHKKHGYNANKEKMLVEMI